MANEKNGISVIQIICTAIAVVIGMIFVFGFGGALSGWLGAGLGALIGLGLYLIVKVTNKS